ncbi:phosphotransferase [Bradyrhizobium sp. ISRA443]|uniref:phosphotransferase n=1 Tax=unclassified Bradyrhizobium TaxID=2631580 RepID=UPI0024796068|nr:MULTISPECIES: phosphotransferase [unclassified Bradyrhizobium]WGR93721.1 phosphotransferase [Bradyrhizobium sp. ISRA435]WGR98304.1 phosphotransferase [Bradyrhizobium sp. ISRA436]WGS05192.1 phosphotransferase [Bradyrhizobium sp. ISRA437]WGS12078.1 phosphotransferase [Bradyrhizobium sp. ISRA443]
MNDVATLNESRASVGDVLSSHWTLLPVAEVEDLVARIYCLSGSVTRLSSERDETFKFVATTGDVYVLKIANPVEDPASLAFQDGALMHLEATAPDVPVPRLIPTLQGVRSYDLALADGAVRKVRLLSYLDGDQLYRLPASTARNHNLGRVLAILGQGLASFQGRPPAGKLLWDISHTLDLADLVGHVGDERQPLVRGVLDAFAQEIPQAAGWLPHQIIHNDFNPHNILVDAAAPLEIAGIIDFGDMVFAPRVNDLAVALAYHLATDDWQNLAGAILRGYGTVTRLEADEVRVLPVLIKARVAMSIIISEWRAASRPDNRDYILRNHHAAWQGLQRLSGLSASDLERFVSSNCEG